MLEYVRQKYFSSIIANTTDN